MQLRQLYNGSIRKKLILLAIFSLSLLFTAVIVKRGAAASLQQGQNNGLDYFIISSFIFLIVVVLAVKGTGYSAISTKGTYSGQADEKYRHFIEQASDGVIIYSFDGNIYEFNEAAHKLAGYSREEFARLKIPDLLFEEAIILNHTNAKKIEAGETVLFERILKGKTGISIPVEINARMLPDGRKLAFVRDITERKQSEEKLNKLSLIARETVNAVVITNTNQQITWVNEAFTRITGFEKNEVLGKRPGDLLQGPETNPATIAYMQEKIRQIVAFECDILNYTKTGEKYWLRIQCQPQFDARNNHTGFFALQTDITKEKKFSEELISSEERYKHLFDNNPACIYIWDMNDLRILEVNETAINKYGYSKEEFSGLSVLDLQLPPLFDGISNNTIEERKSHLTDPAKICKHTTKSGISIYMHIASRPITYRGEKVMMAIGHDITETEQLRQKLEEERSQRQFEITEAVISAQENERNEIGRELHDNINQLLASARLYLGMIGKNADKTSLFTEKTDKLLLSAINEIRTLSHALIPPAVNDTALTEGLQDILSTLSITGSVQVSTDFSGIDENTLSDKLKLTIFRITQEQVHNIIKYASAKRVWLHLTRKENTVALTIKDDGCGFDTTQKVAGVGLMNIKTRTALLNGDMTIISEPGKGCELNIVFHL